MSSKRRHAELRAERMRAVAERRTGDVVSIDIKLKAVSLAAMRAAHRLRSMAARSAA